MVTTDGPSGWRQEPSRWGNPIVNICLVMVLLSGIALAQGPTCKQEKLGFSLPHDESANTLKPSMRTSRLDTKVPTQPFPAALIDGQTDVAVSTSSPEKPLEKAPADIRKDVKKEKRGEIIAVPIPISSPALGTGFIPVVGYIFPMNKNDKETPPSIVGGVGLITNGGSRALAVGGKLYLKGGAYQVSTGLLGGHLDYNFYGTGSAAGDAGRKLAIVQTGRVAFGEVLRRVGRKFYVGPRVWVGHSEIERDLNKSDPEPPEIPQTYLRADVKAFGFRLLRDARPNQFYPTGGSVFDFTSNFFYVSPSAGTQANSGGAAQTFQRENFSFQAYRLTINEYVSLAKNQVLAYQLSVCGVNGDAPFYGQCIFGTENKLRGYVAGQYIDRRMFATQVEYRLELPMRLGVAVFGGVGEVAPSLGKFNHENLLPAVGIGPRFNLSKKYHVNLRLDFAQGKNGHTWSVGVGEAF